MSKWITSRIDDETSDRFDKLVENTNVSKQSHIQIALQKYIANFQPEDIINMDNINKLKES